MSNTVVGMSNMDVGMLGTHVYMLDIDVDVLDVDVGMSYVDIVLFVMFSPRWRINDISERERFKTVASSQFIPYGFVNFRQDLLQSNKAARQGCAPPYYFLAGCFTHD